MLPEVLLSTKCLMLENRNQQLECRDIPPNAGMLGMQIHVSASVFLHWHVLCVLSIHFLCVNFRTMFMW